MSALITFKKTMLRSLAHVIDAVALGIVFATFYILLKSGGKKLGDLVPIVGPFTGLDVVLAFTIFVSSILWLCIRLGSNRKFEAFICKYFWKNDRPNYMKLKLISFSLVLVLIVIDQLFFR